MSNSDFFLKKTLGEDFFESLEKFELYKPGTRSVVDHEEIKTALKIVPRVILSFLIYHLTSMEVGESKEIQIPITAIGAMLNVTKHERDVYSGELVEDNKKVCEFKFRTIPGVGLVIMSAFELYDTSKLLQDPEEPKQGGNVTPPVDIEIRLQSLVAERLAMHDLVSRVVDKKLEQREEAQRMLGMLRDLIAESQAKDRVIAAAKMVSPTSDACPVVPALQDLERVEKGHQKLKKFIEQRKKPKEFDIHMAKGEHVDCPDCGKNIFDGAVFSGCICLGDDREKKIYVKKSENGIKVRFGRGWDAENIEMLVEVLRRKRGE